MLPLYSPHSEIELLILRSILDDAGIHYFVRNESFGSLYLGAHLEAYNRKTICVPEVEADEARALLAEYLRRTGPEAADPAPSDDHPPERHGSWLLRLIDRLLHRWRREEPGGTPALRVIRNDESTAPASRRPRRAGLRLVHGFRPSRDPERPRRREPRG
ncbi:MAG TPA: DUF2007 domain-containing protein [Thermoanaerobaculia bacterium]|nr:DUF2007 domain-containing protein [Thermoanaerobaculia bacterium]